MKYTLLIVFALFMASCNSTQKLLCRNWKIDAIKFGDDTHKPSGQIEGMISKQLTNFKVSFKKDGTYLVDRKDSVIVVTWKLESDKKTFQTKSSTGDTEAKIQELTKTKLVFENIDSTQNKMVITCTPITDLK